MFCRDLNNKKRFLILAFFITKFDDLVKCFSIILENLIYKSFKVCDHKKIILV